MKFVIFILFFGITSCQEEESKEASETSNSTQPIFVNQINKDGLSTITSLLYKSRRKPFTQIPKPLIPKMHTAVEESEDKDYVKYKITTPSIPSGVPIQNFFVDLLRDTITVRARVFISLIQYFSNGTMLKHNFTMGEDYRAVVYLDYPARVGTIPVISKHKQKDDTLEIEVKIAKLAYFITLTKNR